jgi:hypothetical protein
LGEKRRVHEPVAARSWVRHVVRISTFRPGHLSVQQPMPKFKSKAGRPSSFQCSHLVNEASCLLSLCCLHQCCHKDLSRLSPQKRCHHNANPLAHGSCDVACSAYHLVSASLSDLRVKQLELKARDALRKRVERAAIRAKVRGGYTIRTRLKPIEQTQSTSSVDSQREQNGAVLVST